MTAPTPAARRHAAALSRLDGAREQNLWPTRVLDLLAEILADHPATCTRCLLGTPECRHYRRALGVLGA